MDRWHVQMHAVSRCAELCGSLMIRCTSAMVLTCGVAAEPKVVSPRTHQERSTYRPRTSEPAEHTTEPVRPKPVRPLDLTTGSQTSSARSSWNDFPAHEEQCMSPAQRMKAGRGSLSDLQPTRTSDNSRSGRVSVQASPRDTSRVSVQALPQDTSTLLLQAVCRGYTTRYTTGTLASSFAARWLIYCSLTGSQSRKILFE